MRRAAGATAGRVSSSQSLRGATRHVHGLGRAPQILSGRYRANAPYSSRALMGTSRCPFLNSSSLKYPACPDRSAAGSTGVILRKRRHTTGRQRWVPTGNQPEAPERSFPTQRARAGRVRSPSISGKVQARGDVMPLQRSCTQRPAEATRNGLDGIPPEPGGRQPRALLASLALGRAPAGGQGRTLLRLPTAAETSASKRSGGRPDFPQPLALNPSRSSWRVAPVHALPGYCRRLLPPSDSCMTAARCASPADPATGAWAIRMRSPIVLVADLAVTRVASMAAAFGADSEAPPPEFY